MLGKVVSSHQRDWDDLLPHTLSAYRASPHETTGYTPNFLMYGRETRAPLDLVYGRPPASDNRSSTYSSYTQDLAERMETAYRIVREQLKTAAERRKHKYDMRVRPAVFAPGDLVWYYTPRRYQRRSPKWQRMYTGPYRIVDQCGMVNYRLQKSPATRPFTVHVDKLRRCLDEGTEEVGEVAPDRLLANGEEGRRSTRVTRRPARYQ